MGLAATFWLLAPDLGDAGRAGPMNCSPRFRPGWRRDSAISPVNRHAVVRWSGRACGLGGGGRGGAGEAPRLLDQAAEPLDGLLVGAEVVAVQRLLGAPVLFGLL